MIFKVIGLAKELRYLHLEYFLGCFGYLPMSSSFSLRCSALAALTHLTHLHLSYIGGNNLVIPFSEAGDALKSVRLTRWGYDEDLISLRSALSEMANVEKLVLEDIQFIPERAQSQRDPDKIVKYAVKELVLVDVHLGVTPAQLIRMMPELHTLRIGPDHGYYGACFDPPDTAACPAPAPSLRLLSVLDAHQCCPERLPWQPDALFAILTRPNNNDLVRALNVCDARSLVGLRLRFSQVVADVWHAIVEYAPQLTWLELESIHDDGHFSVLAKLVRVAAPIHIYTYILNTMMHTRTQWCRSPPAPALKVYSTSLFFSLAVVPTLAPLIRLLMKSGWKSFWGVLVSGFRGLSTPEWQGRTKTG